MSRALCFLLLSSLVSCLVISLIIRATCLSVLVSYPVLDLVTLLETLDTQTTSNVVNCSLYYTCSLGNTPWITCPFPLCVLCFYPHPDFLELHCVAPSLTFSWLTLKYVYSSNHHYPVSLFILAYCLHFNHILLHICVSAALRISLLVPKPVFLKNQILVTLLMTTFWTWHTWCSLFTQGSSKKFDLIFD